MRIRWVVLAVVAMFFGALGGAILAPQPAGAVSRDMIELQQTVNQLLQGQTDMRSAIDSNNATLKTLIQQSLDSVSKLNSQMDALQKTVQDSTANNGSRLDTVTQQTQGLSDNVQDIQARVGKLSQQLTDMQSLLQSIDSKVSGSAPAGGAPTGAPRGAPDANAPGAAPAPGVPSTMNSPAPGRWDAWHGPNFRGYPLSKCAARLHQRKLQPRAPGILGLHQALSRRTISRRIPSFISARSLTSKMISRARFGLTKKFSCNIRTASSWPPRS